MNEPVVAWCRAQGLEVTRSRAYRKNDQAWVEQKNGAIVRRLVGYGRFEGMAAAEALARLYAAARLHTNLFQPSFKLREKVRVGARVTKRWHPPATPAERALASGRLDAESMARIAELRGRADPVIALAAIRAAQAELGRRVDSGVPRRPRGRRRSSSTSPPASQMPRGTASAARCRPYRRVKPIPKRPSMLDPHQAEIEAWLEAQPEMTAVDVLARLKERHSERLADVHLRTTQRLVKAWRAERRRG